MVVKSVRNHAKGIIFRAQKPKTLWGRRKLYFFGQPLDTKQKQENLFFARAKTENTLGTLIIKFVGQPLTLEIPIKLDEILFG